MANLWDDSALITAFNSAMVKYKDMHGLSGKNRPHGQKTCDQETEIANSESTSLMLDSTDQGEAEKLEVLQEGETSAMKSVDDCQQKRDGLVVDHGVDNIYIYEQEGIPAPQEEELLSHETFSGDPADYRKQERESILSQLQILAKQQQKLEHQLACLGNASMEEATTSAACYSQPLSQQCPKEQFSTYPATADYCYTCLSQYWNAYYNSLGSSSSWPSATSPSTRIHCQQCALQSNVFQSNHQETAVTPPGASKFCSASQKLSDASNLPEMVRMAVAEALKAAESQLHTGETNQTLLSEFSEVALAWFLAGFHTSRYFSHGNAFQ